MTQKNVEGTVQGKIVHAAGGRVAVRAGRGLSRQQLRLPSGPGAHHQRQLLVRHDRSDLGHAKRPRSIRRAAGAGAEGPALRSRSCRSTWARRRSQYDLFGGVNTWKADLNWRPVLDVPVRGGYRQGDPRAERRASCSRPTVTGNLNIGAGPERRRPVRGRQLVPHGRERRASGGALPGAGRPGGACIRPIHTASIRCTAPRAAIPRSRRRRPNTFSVGTVWSPHFEQRPDAQVPAVGRLLPHRASRMRWAHWRLTDILPRCFNSDGISNPGYSAGNIYCQQITRDRNTGDIVLGHEGLLNLASYKTDGMDTQVDWGFGLDALGLSGQCRQRSGQFAGHLHPHLQGVVAAGLAGSRLRRQHRQRRGEPGNVPSALESEHRVRLRDRTRLGRLALALHRCDEASGPGGGSDRDHAGRARLQLLRRRCALECHASTSS